MVESTRASCGAAPSEIFFLHILKFDCKYFSHTKLLRVDSTGTHVNGEGNYGFCGTDCTAVSLFDLIGNLLGEISYTSLPIVPSLTL